MSNTHDYDIANAVGATFRADLNTCLGIHFDNLNNIKSLDILKSLY